MSRTTCAACRHDIDASARICPYCGADPRSGTKPLDTEALLKEEFSSHHGTASENLMQFARQRQGIVIAFGIGMALLLLAGVHAFVTRRNAQAVSAASALPLTEVTDLSNQPDENRPLPMPALQYQFDGHPQTLRTFVVEPGAVVPPEVVAAQQQAAQQAAAALAAKQAAAQPAKPGVPATGQPVPAGPPRAMPAPAASPRPIPGQPVH